MTMTNSGSPYRSDKVRHQHLDRLAVVYVRQSSLRQVAEHQESTRLQYGLTERAIALGWPPERILVIDEDLGRSAATAQGRPGFQRMVADVGLDRVGIVLGTDMSRLARSCKDWYHLLEVCALFGTLIADLDGLYDPAVYNDRLLLGLKGTMSEAELHTIKQRLYSGKRAKAERGEMVQNLPLGFVRRPSGEIVQDPDERARHVVSLIFGTFEQKGTAYGVLRYLVKHGIQFPIRERTGPSKGDLSWREPNLATLLSMLANPAYAGAYVWGRRPTDPRRKHPGKPGTGRISLATEQWAVCLQDRLPAYITWEQFTANQTRLHNNQSKLRGVPRQGTSLLAGLLRCGKCGRRMSTHYGGLQQRLRYHCSSDVRERAGEHCQSLSGALLDQMVEQLVLDAVQPAALELSLQVATDIAAERQRLDRHWQQRLEQTRYEADRARRQYAAVEPENRLVARQLERDWNQALVNVAQLEDDYQRHLAQRPPPMTSQERAEIQRIAQDIPSVWHAKTTTQQERQTIVGLLVDKVVVTVLDGSEQVDVVVHWQGGHQTQARLRRTLRYAADMSNRTAFGERAVALQRQGKTLGQIAKMMDEEGFHAPRGGPLTVRLIHTALRDLGHTRKQQPSEARIAHDQEADEVPLLEAATRLGMPHQTLRVWIDNGKAKGRVARSHGNPVVLVTLNEAEFQRLLAIRQQPAKGKRMQEHQVAI
jgi:DNA invertase Pin-like site-specific DNA recombinase